jgi:prepilin-type N-terminal cleavage/methylation domain-containing protein
MHSEPQRCHKAGFTLVEVMIALPLVALLLIGSFNLFLMSLRLGTKTSAQLVATQDAANAIQQVVEVGREANAISLLGSGNPTPTGYSNTNFSTTLNGQTINTGIWVTMPSALAPVDIGYTNASLNYITVVNNQGVAIPATQTAPMSGAPYNSVPTAGEVSTETTFLIYRANKDGSANPGTGGYLWEQPISPSGTGYALCRTIATGTPNAVQFFQPTTVNQIEVKIVSGVYSAVNGVQTDEEGNGTFTSQLDGKCILMRDHNPTGTESGGTTSNVNPFTAH